MQTIINLLNTFVTCFRCTYVCNKYLVDFVHVFNCVSNFTIILVTHYDVD